MKNVVARSFLSIHFMLNAQQKFAFLSHRFSMNIIIIFAAINVEKFYA
jgi:hypothetical protein